MKTQSDIEQRAWLEFEGIVSEIEEEAGQLVLGCASDGGVHRKNLLERAFRIAWKARGKVDGDVALCAMSSHTFLSAVTQAIASQDEQP